MKTGPVAIHGVNLFVTGAIRDKYKLVGIRRTGRLPVVSRMVGQPGLGTAVRIHRVDLGVTVAVGGEENLVG
jgi:hypothetical protein